jgi:hypothetical protein
MDNVTREPTGAYPSDAVGDVGGQVDMIVAGSPPIVAASA